MEDCHDIFDDDFVLIVIFSAPSSSLQVKKSENINFALVKIDLRPE